ncbi:MAG: Mur ligase family protein [bacterium]
MRKIIQYILRFFAKMVLWKYNPEIIAVTGSVGKTSTKEAIYHVLRKKFKVRRNVKNYNNEIGVALTILGLETGGKSIIAWINNFLKALATILWKRDYPEILILEMGVDKPGDMKYLMNFVPIKVGVITAIGEFPSHLEFFPEKDNLIQEKSLMIQSLSKKGLAVLNYDDLSVRMMGDNLPEKTKTIYYGYGQGADVKISNYDVRIGDLTKRDFGINFKLEYDGSTVPVKLNKSLDKQRTFAVAAAAAVGLHYGLNLIEISSSLIKYRPLYGRNNLIRGIKRTWILDDAYNASPMSTVAALENLVILSEVEERSEEPRRKIAVLGDMLELGQATEDGHRQVGVKVAGVADYLFTVGDRARFIADEARKQGFAGDKIFEFSTAEEAKMKVQEFTQEDDIILIKGSRGIHMEIIIKEIMAHPEKAEKLLDYAK